MNKTWTEPELSFIRTNANAMSDEEMAKHISKIRGREVSKACVRKQRQRMGLEKTGGRSCTKLALNQNKSQQKD